MIRLATDPDPPGRPWRPPGGQAVHGLDHGPDASGVRRRIRPAHAWPFLSRPSVPVCPPVPEGVAPAPSPATSPERMPGVP